MVYREAVKLSGDKVLGLVFSRFGLRLSRFAAFFVALVMVSGTLMWAGPQVASAREAQQLSTCLNLATGANRVLVRGVCDLVLEMAQSWDAIAVEEPGVRYFSARTLAHAVLLNTGGDVSRFKKKDWVNLARLQVANRPAVSQGVRDKAAVGDVVRAIVTTCVKKSTGAVRVVNSGECENSVETQRRWVSLEPLQKPVIGQGAPGVPVIGDVSTLGATQSVTVQPPAETGSSPIRSITVIAIPGGKWVTIGGGAGGTAFFTGLSPDIKYTFLVVAVNDSGAGPRIPAPVTISEPVSITKPDLTPTSVPSPVAAHSAGTGSTTSPATPTVAPGAPSSVVATSGVAQASVAFTAPSSTGGASITSYTVTSSPGGFTASGASSPIVVTGLTNGTAYTFTVTATNSVGTGIASGASSSTTPLSSQLITFVDPGTISFGTTPTLSATSDSSLTVAFTSSTSGVCTITTGGLLAFVAAGTCTINADQVGDGTYSAATRVSRSFTISAVVPGAPTIGTATASSGQTSVAFTAPASTGGASITSYTVTSNTGGHTASGSSSPLVVTGLTNGTAYTFTVTATNSVGTGSASGASGSVTGLGSQSITFADPGTKSFGTTPTLTATSTSALTVAFTSSSSGVCTITSGGVLTFVAAGTCVINADQGGNSSTSAATQVTQSFTVLAVVPGTPTSVVATASSGQVSIAFVAPASSGGASITSYTVTSSPGAVTGSGSSSPIVVTGLTNGTAYTFTVAAINTAGTGPYSSASSAVTPDVTYALGDIGPGGGKVFYISGSGLRYEMAPKNWNDPTNASAVDPAMAWCNAKTDVTGALGTAIGTGAANTIAMDAACTSGAGQAAADYAGGSKTDWFLPSLSELNAMCNYSRTWTGTPSAAGCGGSQNSGFASGPYGFTTTGAWPTYGNYWMSNQNSTLYSPYQDFSDGLNPYYDDKFYAMRVRPVRSF